ncbi:MAG: PAS domain-containing protein, partial [Armatimonadota bacterium]
MSEIDLSSDSSHSAVMSVVNASQQRFETMFDALGEGVVYQNPKGEIVIHNAAAAEILGLTSDELEGRASVDPRWQALRRDGSPFPGDQHPAMVALRTGERQTDVLMNVLKPNGTRTWIKINSIPLFDSSNSEPIAAVTSFSD